MIQLGRKVKDFKLKDHNNALFQLSACQGKKVLLSFHPLAWTAVCAQQMKALEAQYKTLEKLNVAAVGVSVDSVPCKAAWARELKIKHTPLLADFWPHGGLAKALGIFREEGFSERANILVNEEGRAAFIKIYPIKELPDFEEILSQLQR